VSAYRTCTVPASAAIWPFLFSSVTWLSYEVMRIGSDSVRMSIV
jgi:hypothetical protein